MSGNHRGKDDWSRLALARIRAAHTALQSAGDKPPRPVETVTHLLEAADELLRQWISSTSAAGH